MRSNRTILSILAASFAMFALILDAKTALEGAMEGVQLCITTAIPSLFPFIVISTILTALLSGRNYPFLHPLGRILSLPPDTEHLILLGFLGGYPTGAQNIAQTYKSGLLSKKQAEHLLPFCNNAGPAFIFGIGIGLLDNIWLCVLLWLVHISSALLIGFFTPVDRDRSTTSRVHVPISLTDAVNRSITVITSVCGWIILFRTLLAFLQHWVFWLFPEDITVLLRGFFELTNGCCSLDTISSIGERFVLFSVMLAFGGLCVLLQTQSILSEYALSAKIYFLGKITQASASYLLCVMIDLIFPNLMDFSPQSWMVSLACLICFCYRKIITKPQKDIAFLQRVMYNGKQSNSGGSTYEVVSQES